MNDVLQLFHGLDDRQALHFRRAIMPTLAYLRELIVVEDLVKRNSQGKPRNSGETVHHGREHDDKES
jgi:hypothetical protein